MDGTATRPPEGLWRALFERAGDPMLLLDGSRHVVQANDAAVALIGMSADHLQGSAVADLLTAKDAAVIDDCWSRLVERGELVATTDVVPADGRRRVVQIHARAHVVPGRHVAILRDVTESTARARAVAQSEARYRVAFDHAPAPLALADADGRIVAANHALCALLGRSADELASLSVNDVTHPADRGAVLVEGGAEVRLLDAHGDTVLARTSTTCVTDEHGDPVHFVVHVEDVGEQRQVEALQREAVRIDTMARIAGGFGPEFNNALMAVGGYAELLEARVGDDPALADGVRSIRRSQERAVAMTRRLLELARCQVSRPQQVPLEDRLAPMLPRLTAVAGARVGVRLRLEHPAATVAVDPAQLEWIVEELVVNARDAMPDGGRVTIATSAPAPAGLEGAPLRWLTVADTGDGMDDRTKASALMPFFTTKARPEALGVGLPAVQGIVYAAGGVLHITSVPGEGTTVAIGLPLVAPPEAWPPPSR